MATGQLKIKSKTKKNGNIKKTIEFFFTNDQGEYRSLNYEKISRDQVALGLLKKIEATSSGTFQVQFEQEGDSILKLREHGQPWDREPISELPYRTQSPDKPKATNPDYFHNPYNFVPAIPRDGVEGELGDRKPVGHGRYLPDRWTGRIAVKLTTVTPLLIPDASEMTSDQNDHETYPVRLGADGKPYLPPTSIKGMLRSAYEAVTNSRLSVFKSHDLPLAYRMSAEDAAIVKPARVESSSGRLRIRIFKESIKLPFSKILGVEHGDCVRIKAIDNKVAHIEPWEIGEDPGPDWKTGWACITGRNIKDKKNECVFIESNSEYYVDVNDTISSLWENLIADYQKIHEKELANRRKKDQSPQDYLGDDPGQTAWSRHIYDLEQRKLDGGILCYVELQEDSNLDDLHPRDVIALQPVTISRRLYAQKPIDLLPETLRPAPSKNVLSPADRVFGWVNQNGNGSYKGHLRIHSLECQTSSAEAIEIFSNLGVPLAVLGQPKPSQARFYAAGDKIGTPLQHDRDKKQGYGNERNGLRGRKFYPYHNRLPESYWKQPETDLTSTEIDGYFQGYRRPSGENERDSQNRSITSWINPNTIFTFDIDVNNLSTVELGALLWLLELPEGSYHRLGGGKPFGFGSVRLEIDFDSSDLRTGRQWNDFYRSLKSIDRPAFDPSQCIDEYRNAVAQAYARPFESLSFIEAFCRVAKGFEDGLPIHYPWNPEMNGKPDPKGENFKWFTDNEKGDRLSLPSLQSGRALPQKPRTKAKKAQGKLTPTRVAALARPTSSSQRPLSDPPTTQKKSEKIIKKQKSRDT